jgi:hypothetical protein
LESYKDQKIITVEKVTKLINQISGDNDVGDLCIDWNIKIYGKTL